MSYTLKKKSKFRGNYANFSISIISQLLGRSRTYTKQLLYQFGKKEQNTLTMDQLAWLIWQERTKQKIKEVKKLVPTLEYNSTSLLDISDMLNKH